jgi:predicted O-methyltransferase YrrM
VMTTNLKPEDLATYIGESAIDRLRAMVGNKLVQIDSEPKRRKLADEILARMNAEPEPIVVPQPRH